MRKRVLICGATGYLGKHLVREAHERGHFVRALVRSPEGLGDVRLLCDDIFVGHATQRETLRNLCEGIDVVVSSLGNRTVRRKPTPFDVDYQANIHLMEEAKKSRADQFVFVAVLRGAEMRGRVPQIEAREQVVDALRLGKLPWTVIRPSGFYNDMSELLEMARKGTVWIPNHGARFNPVHGADFAAVCLDQVGVEASYGREIDVGGPDVVTMRELAELACDALDKPHRIRTFPSWMLSLAGRVIRPFNVNFASLLLMFAAFGRHQDGTCEAYGDHHLREFFEQLVASADEGEVALRS